MFRLYFIKNVETKLSKPEIIERLKEITLDDKTWHIFANGKLLFGKFEDDRFSLFYINKEMYRLLLPQIHGKIIEEKESCIIKLSYSATWEHVIIFIFWTFFFAITLKLNVLNIVAHLVFYILGIYAEKRYCISIGKKVANIIQNVTYKGATKLRYYTDCSMEDCIGLLSRKNIYDLFEYSIEMETETGSKITFLECNKHLWHGFQSVYKINFKSGHKTVIDMEFIMESSFLPFPTVPSPWITEFMKQKFDAVEVAE